jgi:DNA-binding transcriptional ArsR family regulator
MDADAQIAPIAALLADPARSTILWALCDGRTLPACELALLAGVTAPTVSYHLEKLIAGRLVAADRLGRHRYYRLADPIVVSLLEALAVVAPPAPARTFRAGQAAKAVRAARTCYDHLAGVLGVQVTEALVSRRCLVPAGRDYTLTRTGERLLGRLEVDVEGARTAHRSFARACLDWSERRHHLAGALGAALLDRMLALRWLDRAPSGRAVRLTDRGRRGLREHLHLRA